MLNPGTSAERNIGKIDVLELAHGDRLLMINPSGGGFGDPFARDPALVLAEVLDGLLSPAEARSGYGVIIRGDALDAAATDAVRAIPRPAPPAFTIGPARQDLERRLPEATSRAMAEAVLALPAGLRPYRLAELRREGIART